MRINENGDRDADYSILDMDPVTKEFQVSLIQRGLCSLTILRIVHSCVGILTAFLFVRSWGIFFATECLGFHIQRAWPNR